MFKTGLDIWQENEQGTYYRWPFYNFGVQLTPAAVLPDVCTEFASLLLDRESSGRVLARIIDTGRKAGISVSLHIDNIDTALEGLPEKHRLIAAVNSMDRSNEISYTNSVTSSYSKSALRRLFGLS